jgi:hypothetical protein
LIPAVVFYGIACCVAILLSFGNSINLTKRSYGTQIPI